MSDQKPFLIRKISEQVIASMTEELFMFECGISDEYANKRVSELAQYMPNDIILGWYSMRIDRTTTEYYLTTDSLD